MFASVVLAASLLTSALIFALILVLILKIRSLKRDFIDFITAPDNKTPSKCAEWVDAMSMILSARLITSLRAALQGGMGGMAKAANAEAMSELAGAHPVLNLASMFMPGLFKKLGKNPAALAALTQLGNKFGNKGTNVPSDNSGEESNFTIGV